MSDSYRIAVPCGTDDNPRRHRWQWRSVQYTRPGGAGVRDKWCQNCGRWFVDVIEHRAGSETPPAGSGPETP